MLCIVPSYAFIQLNIPYFYKNGKRDQLKEERDEKILELYLQCCTQQQIADELSISQMEVSRVIDNLKQNGNIAKLFKDFKPQLYNIWSFAKNNNDSKPIKAIGRY